MYVVGEFGPKDFMVMSFVLYVSYPGMVLYIEVCCCVSEIKAKAEV